MIGRADIEGSKSDVAMNAWPPQASYPCGNFSDTSCLKPQRSEGSHNPTDGSFAPLAPQPSTYTKCLNLRFLSY
uniref:Uncharacterized protein n=1 Tax=Ovis aries TaxID=9940 RepID=A0AC11D0G4_SHEEP